MWNGPLADVIGCGEPATSMIDRRVWPKPTSRKTRKPSPSGPRCASCAAIARSSLSSTGPPSNRRMPTIPHMQRAARQGSSFGSGVQGGARGALYRAAAQCQRSSWRRSSRSRSARASFARADIVECGAMTRRSLLFAATLMVGGCSSPGPAVEKPPEYARTGQELLPYDRQNFAYRWLDVMQEAAARDVDRFGARPTVLSRQMMLWA